jgi:uncharacterized protein
MNRFHAIAAWSLLLMLPVLLRSQPRAAGASDIHSESGVKTRMRDGVELVSDVFRPVTPGRWPTILVRTPYNRRGEGIAGYKMFASHGYAVVLQDVRGRYDSQGEFGSIAHEGADGNDTLDWIALQPWSNGRIGMAGASYPGIAVWRAAVQGNPHLVAIFPMVSGDDEYLDRFYSAGGAMKLGHRLLWLSDNFHPLGTLQPEFRSYITHLPLRTADVAAAGRELPVWQDALDHPSYDSYWQKLSLRPQLEKVHCAVFSMSGWFDNYAPDDLDAFTRLAHLGRDVETSIGPWAHSFTYRFPQLDFGPESRGRVRSVQLAFFDRRLKAAGPPAAESKPRLHLFVMGTNVWREEHEWPLARTRYTSFYLTSQGKANSAAGDGGLVNLPPEKGKFKPDHFVYDPAQPVPTQGGALCCDADVLPPGPLDQSKVERRSDVLVYTSAPLREELEVTGAVRALLYVATSANDTDFTAKLVDVPASGPPRLITDGIARLRYRLSLVTSSFVKRNQPYQVFIEAGVTSYVFLPGHRIRLEVSSSNFPRFDRNLNTMQPVADAIKAIKANQTVFHERKYPSALILPVIPTNKPGPPEFRHPSLHAARAATR